MADYEVADYVGTLFRLKKRRLIWDYIKTIPKSVPVCIRLCRKGFGLIPEFQNSRFARPNNSSIPDLPGQMIPEFQIYEPGIIRPCKSGILE